MDSARLGSPCVVSTKMSFLSYIVIHGAGTRIAPKMSCCPEPAMTAAENAPRTQSTRS
jgi:hypothetical protein